MRPYDAIIIGAGMSGLAAAIRLSLYDKRVCVLEKHELWGGLNSFYTQNGHAFDVGLHALTNFVPARTRGAPLTKVLRQLRVKHAELKLGEHHHSELRVPGLTLSFTNDFAYLQEEVRQAFPEQADGFARLAAAVREYPLDEEERPAESGRAMLESFISEPLLVDALLVPLLYYGSARENDVDWSQMVVLFRSIFLEGLSRPEGGIRPFLNLLIKRLRNTSVDLRLRTGVGSIVTDGGRTIGVRLESGEELMSDCILSSAGFVETMRMCGNEAERAFVKPGDTGRLSFLESISVLDCDPVAIGHTAATVFYSTRTPFRYQQPTGLIDTHSGVISAPSNFASEKPLKENLLRVTVLANYDRWAELPQDEYEREKALCADAALAEAAAITSDWRGQTTYRDIFTPRTVRHFTGHDRGCVYGSPTKRMSGVTDVDGLFLIGTDQGYLGVVGAMMSGIAMANRHVLAASPRHAIQ